MTLFKATAKSADAPTLESGAGLYDGKFMGVTTKFIEGGQYGDGDRFVWTFTLLDDDGAVLREEDEDKSTFGQPIVADGLTSQSLNTQSKTEPKAIRYAKALLTEDEYIEFTEGDGIDMGPDGPIVGRVAQVDIAIRDGGWLTIANVLPKRKARRSSRAEA